MGMENHEYYPTPHWCVHRILERLNSVLLPDNWLEPSVGAGDIVKACDSWYADKPYGPNQWTTYDIVDRGWPGMRVGDYLTSNHPDTFDVCIMNPPFSLALEFAQHAQGQARVVVMLQRLNWLASAERNEWMREHTPDVYVLPNRPSFAFGGTDSHEYAWFVWNQGQGHARIEVLPNTPVNERDKGAVIR